MKITRYFKNPICAGLSCFILGGVTVLAGQEITYRLNEHSPQVAMAEPRRNFDKLFDEELFSRSNDPLQEMNRLHKELLKNFDRFETKNDGFDSWFRNKFGGGQPPDIESRSNDGDSSSDTSSVLKFPKIEGQLA